MTLAWTRPHCLFHIFFPVMRWPKWRSTLPEEEWREVARKAGRPFSEAFLPAIGGP